MKSGHRTSEQVADVLRCAAAVGRPPRRECDARVHSDGGGLCVTVRGRLTARRFAMSPSFMVVIVHGEPPRSGTSTQLGGGLAITSPQDHYQVREPYLTISTRDKSTAPLCPRIPRPLVPSAQPEKMSSSTSEVSPTPVMV